MLRQLTRQLSATLKLFCSSPQRGALVTTRKPSQGSSAMEDLHGDAGNIGQGDLPKGLLGILGNRLHENKSSSWKLQSAEEPPSPAPPPPPPPPPPPSITGEPPPPSSDPDPEKTQLFPPSPAPSFSGSASLTHTQSPALATTAAPEASPTTLHTSVIIHTATHDPHHHHPASSTSLPAPPPPPAGNSRDRDVILPDLGASADNVNNKNNNNGEGGNDINLARIAAPSVVGGVLLFLGIFWAARWLFVLRPRERRRREKGNWSWGGGG
ncbi:hypothetical protein VTK26DRAFT_3699 [Humicola hyalothermophila]